MNKKTVIIGVVIALLLVAVTMARTITINKQVEIDNEAYDYLESKGINVEDKIADDGLEKVEQEVMDHFRRIAEDKLQQIVDTNNVTKVQKIVDEMDNILSPSLAQIK